MTMAQPRPKNNNNSRSLRENNHKQCLVCCNGIFLRAPSSKKFEIPTRPETKNSMPSVTAEILSDLFNVLCKHMNWKDSATMKRHKFNFDKEYFPFCATCRNDLVRIFKVDEQAETILKSLKKITLDLVVEIIETENRTRRHLMQNVNSPGKNTDRSHLMMDSSNQSNRMKLEELENKKSYESKIKHYRDMTFTRFSPTIGLTKYLPRTIKDDDREDSKENNTVLLESEQNVDNSSVIRSSQINCLICCEYVELYDYASKSSAVAKILSNVFHVVQNYMQWDCQRRYHLNFKFEPFPFCKKCRIKLVRIYKLDQQFQPLQKQISGIVKVIHSTMVQSEKRKLFKLDSKIFTCRRTDELVYNPQKVLFYRKLALPNFPYNAQYTGATSMALNLDVMSESENEEKSDYVPTSNDETSSCASASDVEDRTETPFRKRRRFTRTSSSRRVVMKSSPTILPSKTHGRTKQYHFLKELKRVGKIIHQTGSYKFTVDGKIEFEQRSHGTWWCSSCGVSLGNKVDAASILWHLHLHLHKVSSYSQSLGESGNTYQVKQINSTRFQYGMHHFDKEHLYTLKCTTCNFSTCTRYCFLPSIQARHVCYLRAPDFEVRKTRTTVFYCGFYGCYYACDSTSSMCVHVLHCHENNSKLTKAIPKALFQKEPSTSIIIDINSSYTKNQQRLNQNQMPMKAPDSKTTPTSESNKVSIEPHFNPGVTENKNLFQLNRFYPELTISPIPISAVNYTKPQV